MRLLRRAVYRGPHLYSATPMVRLEIDLGPLEGAAHRHPWRTVIAATIIPAVWSAACRVIEHVAIELQELAGQEVTLGKARSVRGPPGAYNVMYAFEDLELALKAGDYAIRPAVKR